MSDNNVSLILKEVTAEENSQAIRMLLDGVNYR